MRTPLVKFLSLFLLCALLIFGTWQAFFRDKQPLILTDYSTFEKRLFLSIVNETTYGGYLMWIYGPRGDIKGLEITVDPPEPTDLFVQVTNRTRNQGHSKLMIFLNGQPVSFSVDSNPKQDYYSQQLPSLGMLNIPVEVDVSELQYAENSITFLNLNCLDDKPSPKKPIQDLTVSRTKKLYVPAYTPGSALDQLTLTPTVEVTQAVAANQEGIILIGLDGEIPERQQSQLSVAPGQSLSISVTAYDPNPVLYSTWIFLDDQPVWLDQEQPNLVWQSGSGQMLHQTITLPAQQGESTSLYVVSIPLKYPEQGYSVQASERLLLLIQD